MIVIYFTYENINDIKSQAADVKVLHFNIHSLHSKLNDLTRLLNVLSDSGHIVGIIRLCEIFMIDQNINKCKNRRLFSY